MGNANSSPASGHYPQSSYDGSPSLPYLSHHHGGSKSSLSGSATSLKGSNSMRQGKTGGHNFDIDLERQTPGDARRDEFRTSMSNFATYGAANGRNVALQSQYSSGQEHPASLFQQTQHLQQQQINSQYGSQQQLYRQRLEETGRPGSLVIPSHFKSNSSIHSSEQVSYINHPRVTLSAGSATSSKSSGFNQGASSLSSSSRTVSASGSTLSFPHSVPQSPQLSWVNVPQGLHHYQQPPQHIPSQHQNSTVNHNYNQQYQQQYQQYAQDPHASHAAQSSSASHQSQSTQQQIASQQHQQHQACEQGLETHQHLNYEQQHAYLPYNNYGTSQGPQTAPRSSSSFKAGSGNPATTSGHGTSSSYHTSSTTSGADLDQFSLHSSSSSSNSSSSSSSYHGCSNNATTGYQFPPYISSSSAYALPTRPLGVPPSMQNSTQNDSLTIQKLPHPTTLQATHLPLDNLSSSDTNLQEQSRESSKSSLQSLSSRRLSSNRHDLLDPTGHAERRPLSHISEREGQKVLTASKTTLFVKAAKSQKAKHRNRQGSLRSSIGSSTAGSVDSLDRDSPSSSTHASMERELSDMSQRAASKNANERTSAKDSKTDESDLDNENGSNDEDQNSCEDDDDYDDDYYEDNGDDDNDEVDENDEGLPNDGEEYESAFLGAKEKPSQYTGNGFVGRSILDGCGLESLSLGGDGGSGSKGRQVAKLKGGDSEDQLSASKAYKQPQVNSNSKSNNRNNSKNNDLDLRDWEIGAASLGSNSGDDDVNSSRIEIPSVDGMKATFCTPPLGRTLDEVEQKRRQSLLPSASHVSSQSRRASQNPHGADHPLHEDQEKPIAIKCDGEEEEGKQEGKDSNEDQAPSRAIGKSIEDGATPSAVGGTPQRIKTQRAVTLSDPDVSMRESRRASGMSKYNSCSTLFIDSTLSRADLEATLHCVSLAILYMIEKNHEHTNWKSADIITEFLHPLTRHPVPRNPNIPSEDTIYTFLSSLFRAAQLSPECAVITLIYLERVIAFAEITIIAPNWKRAVLGALLLASKVWDDQAVWNADFCTILPDVEVKDMNDLERWFIGAIQFNVSIKSSLYAKYYFELRDLAERTEKTFSLKPLNKEDADALEAKTQFSELKMEELSESKEEMEHMRRARSVNDFVLPKPLAMVM